MDHMKRLSIAEIPISRSEGTLFDINEPSPILSQAQKKQVTFPIGKVFSEELSLSRNPSTELNSIKIQYSFSKPELSITSNHPSSKTPVPHIHDKQTARRQKDLQINTNILRSSKQEQIKKGKKILETMHYRTDYALTPTINSFETKQNKKITKFGIYDLMGQNQMRSFIKKAGLIDAAKQIEKNDFNNLLTRRQSSLFMPGSPSKMDADMKLRLTMSQLREQTKSFSSLSNYKISTQVSSKPIGNANQKSAKLDNLISSCNQVQSSIRSTNSRLGTMQQRYVSDKKIKLSARDRCALLKLRRTLKIENSNEDQIQLQ